MAENIIVIICGAIFSAVMISIAYFINGKTQPKQLWMLFFTEMWERFSFYGMRALLILYMVNVLKMADDTANFQYAAYNALVYTTPLLGGWLADRILGYRKSIVLGGILMAIGHLVLALPQDYTFFLGLGFLITGNGFFKPNISSLLGKFYEANDHRKDTGYSIFYMGVNIGAFLGSLLCGYIGQEVDWHYGFGLAGIFMVLGLSVFILFKHNLEDKGLSPEPEKLAEMKSIFSMEKWLYIGAFALVPICMLLVKLPTITTYILYPLGVVAMIYLVYLSQQFDLEGKQKMWAAVILITFSYFFWGFYEQAGGSLNLMAERNVDFYFNGSKLSSAMMNNSINPFYIIFLTPLLGMFWTYADRNLSWINIPFKFGFSFILVGLGYMVFYQGGATGLANASGLMPLVYFMGAYFLITLGELFISPIGLSMITKLSPANMFGFMMGVWFLASALGHKLAGFIGGRMSIPKLNESGLPFTAMESLPIYMNGCKQIAMASLMIGLVILVSAKLIQRWMHGVK
jgi:proton-dependent oligopeptide transporter, POT family